MHKTGKNRSKIRVWEKTHSRFEVHNPCEKKTKSPVPRQELYAYYWTTIEGKTRRWSKGKVRLRSVAEKSVLQKLTAQNYSAVLTYTNKLMKSLKHNCYKMEHMFNPPIAFPPIVTGSAKYDEKSLGVAEKREPKCNITRCQIEMPRSSLLGFRRKWKWVFRFSFWYMPYSFLSTLIVFVHGLYVVILFYYIYSVSGMLSSWLASCNGYYIYAQI